ncbi:InlB B-repeat-containing protein [Blautia sp. HCP3S3_C4]|uniref:InlB B-repeat-containing protein n=1 Tax=Blautia sp. HCP3S3_C4 TaxID=3438911 RepID=UPI003F8B08A1
MRRKFRKILALTTAIAVVAGVLPLDGGALSSKITNGGLTVSAAEFTSPETGNGVTPEEDPEVTFSDNDASVESAETLFTDNGTADNEGALQDGEEEITVQSVQNLIDALPSSEEVSEMSFEEQEKVYEKLQNAYETYETLTEEEKSQLTGMDAFDELFDYFNGMVSAAGAGESNGLTVTQSNGGTDFYVYDEATHTLTINDTGKEKITISGTTTVDHIVVKGDNTVNIILDNVNIQQSSSWTSAFLIETGAIVNLTLKGKNVLQSGISCAGLQVEGTLNITGGENGSLQATGGAQGAGIGGGENKPGGTINITGGTVTATGGAYGAGIGGGSSGAGGIINITGGTVIAISLGSSVYIGGAGIGGGKSGAGGIINIKGGTVTATGDNCGAGIGGGSSGAVGEINITGGEVTATGGVQGAGIGGGKSGAGGTINIKGGTVTATGGAYGAGIGGGDYGAGGDISITGGTVTANAGCYTSNQGGGGAGIGAGNTYNPPQGTNADSIVINGGIVIANSFKSGVADISNLTAVTGRAVIICQTGGIKVSPEQSLIIGNSTTPSNDTLTYYGTIENNGTITNNGTIENKGTIENNGTISGNGTIDFRGGGSITGNAVESGVTLKYSVKKTGSENIYFAEEHDDNKNGYSATLSAKPGYVLPDDIFVTIAGNLIEKVEASNENGYSYTYNNTDNSAELKIPKILITGNIVIEVKAKLVSPEILTWSSSTPGKATVTWKSVNNASGYSVQLYNTVSGNVKDATVDESEHTFDITEEGSYAVKVKAKGAGNYADSAEKTSSPLQFYSVNFITDNGEGLSPQVVVKDGKVLDPLTGGTVLTKNGYTFAGWYSDSNFTENSKWDFDNSTVQNDTTLYARWYLVPVYSYYTITASAGTGGTITPSGSCSIREWLDKTFTITPDSGYEIADVLVDGKSVGAQSSYTFEDVRSNHTISASFLKIVPQEYPDGTKAKPDGSFETPDGTVILPDGTIVLPDGIRIEPDEEGNRPVIDKDNVVTAPDGTVYKPDGTIHNTDGSVQDHAGTYLSPAKTWIDSVNAVGNKITILLTGEAAGAIGYDYVIGTSADMLKTREYYKISKNKLGTETLMQYVEKGTYYAACHAWIRGADGKKVFGPWSELKEFQVDAVTPETPKIKNVKVSKQTVTVTYTVCSDAEGYDIVLGKEYKKVNEEKRPVNYGTLVKKVKNGNTVTVTFRNVTPGTYYAGLHSWNRTSEDGKKVFSPWSGVKKVVVK